MKNFLFIIFVIASKLAFGQVTATVIGVYQTCGETPNSPICKIEVIDALNSTAIFTPILPPNIVVLSNTPIFGGSRFIFGLNNGPQDLNNIIPFSFTQPSGPGTSVNFTISTPIGVTISSNSYLTPISVCSNAEPLNLSSLQLSILEGRWNLDGNSTNIEEFDPSASVQANQVLIYSKVNQGCLDKDTVFVTIIPAPSGVTLTAGGAGSTTCSGNDATLQANLGSNSAIAWYLSNGENGLGNSPQTFINLAPGTYALRVVNGVNNCRTQVLANIENSALAAFPAPVVTNITCFGANNGQIALDDDFNPDIAFLWNTGSTSGLISGLGPGEYRVKMTLQGCSSFKSFTLTEPDEIVPELNITAPSCGLSDGIISITSIPGAVGSSIYDWIGTGSVMGSDLIGTSAGNYSLTVTDNNGCIGIKRVSISDQNSIPAFSNLARPDCGVSNGGIDVTPLLFGGTVQSTLWGDGVTTLEDMLNVPSSVYTCEITSSTGCKSNFSWNLRSKRPAKQDICLVTVDLIDNYNIVVWTKPIAVTDISHFNIYRELATSGKFELIDTVQFSSLSEYKDSVADANERSWRYKISAVNTCAIEGPKSDRYKTMQRNILPVPGQPTKRRIVWDAYEGSNTVANYLVYRKSQTSPNWVLISTVVSAPIIIDYLDTPPEILGLDYYIQTVFSAPCVSTKANSYRYSRSNKQRGEAQVDNLNEAILTDGSRIILYPNPAENELILETESNSKIDVAVTSMDGKIVKTLVIEKGKTSVDVANLSSGTYLVRFVDETTSVRLIFVKK